MSPLLFDIFLEPLAMAFCKRMTFKGIVREEISHKISAYVDDILLFISDPIVSVPAILDILEKYGKLSGYKLNLEKSQLFPVNNAALNMQLSNLPFKMVYSKFRYLGITVRRSYSQLYKSNFSPLIDKCKKDFHPYVHGGTYKPY